MATERIRYVDTASSGGDGTTNALSGANAAYTSLSALEDAEDGSLVTADAWLHVYCKATNDDADTTACVFSGWTTDSTRYILIEASTGERATASGWKTDRYRLSVSNAVALNFNSGADHVVMDGMQIEVPATNANSQAPLTFAAKAAGSTITLKNCRLRGMASSTFTNVTITGSDADVTLTLWNVIVEKHANHAGSWVDGISVSVGAAYLYNVISYGFRNGIRDSAGSVVRVYDSVSFNNTDDFTGTFHTVDYCASDDNDGTNNVAESGGADWANDFEDAPNGDFRLVAGSNLIGAASRAGSSLFSDDIDGTTRGAAWDLGAYEYVSASASATVTPTPIGSIGSTVEPSVRLEFLGTRRSTTITFTWT